MFRQELGCVNDRVGKGLVWVMHACLVSRTLLDQAVDLFPRVGVFQCANQILPPLRGGIGGE